MNSRRFRHRITIKSPQSNKNEYGENTTVWVDFKSLWASMEPLIGREYFAAESVQSKVEVKFRTRYRSDIDRTMRIQHGNELYEIVSEPINVEGRNRESLIYAKRVI